MITDAGGRSLVVVDCHVHIGRRAAASGLVPGRTFAVEALLDEMDAAGVDAAVVFPRAYPTTDYRDQNAYILECLRRHPGRLVAFARIQPLYGERAIEDVRRFAGEGARGLKIHTAIDGGNHPANSREVVFPVVEEAARHGLAVLFHSSGYKTCTPTQVGDVAEHFPDTPVIAAHCGLELYEDAIVAARRIPNLYLETSQIVGPGLIARIVREIGAAKVLFGSDAPAYPIVDELEKVARFAHLPDEAMAAVVGGNAARLLGLAVEPATAPDDVVR